MRGALSLALLVAALGAASCGSTPAPAGAPPPPPAAETEAPPATEAPDPAPPAAETETVEAAPERPATTEAGPLPGLPGFTAGYQDWPRLNEEPIPPRDNGDAHLGTKDVYATVGADRAGGRIVYPEGAIVVKEARRPGSDFIGLVAVMRKQAGVDPAHADWVFVEYTRSSPDEPFRETAKDAVCWNCHMGAAGTDYVWVHTLGTVP